MIITIPDPDPGRCQNHRNGRRCLNYDHHDSACMFPEESDPVGWELQHRNWQYTQRKPEPWVSPLEAPDGQ